MAGSFAREGDMLSGHGSYPPHPFPVGGSLAAATFIEGKKVLCVERALRPLEGPLVVLGQSICREDVPREKKRHMKFWCT